MTIDLGCGMRKKGGAVGVDICPLPGVDIVADLTRTPYPFASDSMDFIHMSHVLEHLPDPVAALTELWRIGRGGSTVSIRVPHYSGRYAWVDPTHRRCFAAQSFDYFGANSYSYYTEARFKVQFVRLRYFMEPPSRWLFRLWGRLVQAMIDRHPTFSERYLAYLVGGIDEIEASLEVVK